MKLQAPIAALLLAALPATALAGPRDGGDHRSYSRPASSARSYQAPRYQSAAPRYQSAAPRYSQQRSYSAPERRAYTRPTYDRNSYDVARRDVAANRGWGGDPWGWNGGRVWYGSSGYWGGGFWGDFALGLSFGSVGYYPVQTGFPGADLLANYGLQQTDCDQPNLVDVYGPDGSEVCAYPNDLVAPGEYDVDPSTLTLVSAD